MPCRRGTGWAFQERAGPPRACWGPATRSRTCGNRLQLGLLIETTPVQVDGNITEKMGHTHFCPVFVSPVRIGFGQHRLEALRGRHGRLLMAALVHRELFEDFQSTVQWRTCKCLQNDSPKRIPCSRCTSTYVNLTAGSNKPID